MKHIFQNENEVWYFCHPNLCLPALFWLFSHLFHPLVHLGLSYWILRFSNNNSYQCIDFNLWQFVVSIASMCAQFQTSCVSFVLLALGLCFFWTTWFKMMLCKRYDLWASYSTYILQKWLFNHVSHYWRCFEEKRRRLLFNTRRLQTWRKTGWRHCFAEKASYNFFFSLRKLPQSRKNGLEAFLWRPSLQNVLFKCTFGREGAKVTDNHNVHRNSSF